MIVDYTLPLISDLNKFCGLKVLSLNIRAISSKVNLLRNDLSDLDINFIAFCETWLKEDVTSAFVAIANYNCDCSTITTDGSKIKQGGGLCI